MMYNINVGKSKQSNFISPSDKKFPTNNMSMGNFIRMNNENNHSKNEEKTDLFQKHTHKLSTTNEINYNERFNKLPMSNGKVLFSNTNKKCGEYLFNEYSNTKTSLSNEKNNQYKSSVSKKSLQTLNEQMKDELNNKILPNIDHLSKNMKSFK